MSHISANMEVSFVYLHFVLLTFFLSDLFSESNNVTGKIATNIHNCEYNKPEMQCLT